MKNILIITYWSFNDALIQTYTLPYVSMIRKNLPLNQKIFLFTLEQKNNKMSNEEWGKQQAKFLKKNIHLIRFSYSNFGVVMALKLTYIFFYLFFLLFTQKISHIHTWCTPAGSIGYILSALSGKKLILDSYEPHAEPMLESGTWTKDSLKFKLLFWLEKKQAEKATHIISCVTSMKDYVKSKFNLHLKNVYTKPACVDFDLFNTESVNNKNLTEKYNLKDKVVGVYAGKFEGSYLKEEVFQFLKAAETYWGKDKFRFILLTSHSEKYVTDLITKVGLSKNIIIQLFVPHQEVPQYLSLANFGITPFIPVPSKRYGSPIKNGEYWAMGLPVIITKNISDDSNIIEKENIGYVLQELTDYEYIKACKHIDNLSENGIKDKIKRIAVKYRSFDIAEKVYANIYS